MAKNTPKAGAKTPASTPTPAPAPKGGKKK